MASAKTRVISMGDESRATNLQVLTGSHQERAACLCRTSEKVRLRQTADVPKHRTCEVRGEVRTQMKIFMIHASYNFSKSSKADIFHRHTNLCSL